MTKLAALLKRNTDLLNIIIVALALIIGFIVLHQFITGDIVGGSISLIVGYGIFYFTFRK